MASRRRPLDNSVEIVTPENIAFHYQVAGPFRRMPAYLIDLLIRVGIVILTVMAVALAWALLGLRSAPPGAGVLLVLWFILAWFYGGLFETYWNGQTPGKRLMQLRVLSVDGQPINGLQAVLRNVLRAVDMQPLVFYLLGVAVATMNERFQRLGDLACGTMVVVEEDRWYRGVTLMAEPEALRLAAAIPASFQTTPLQARSLAAYVQRRQYFPWMRRLEIARHLGEPLRQRFGLPPETDLDQLLCGLYYRTFIADKSGSDPLRGESPFRQQTSALAEAGAGEPRMKVSDLVEARQANWRELEALLLTIDSKRAPADAPALARFGALYRAACADLALADAYQLPPEMVRYLHRLVGRAHNQLYRSQSFHFGTWSHQLLVEVPQRLFNDNALRLAFVIFWGAFLASMYLAYRTPGLAERIAGKEMITEMESMYAEPVQGSTAGAQNAMLGFYIYNNAGIGLRCFAYGLIFGIAGLYVTLYNASMLGAVFGYMAQSQHRDNFFHFVTAHGPFELTAIVLSAAAGMRLGFSLIDTRGLTRIAALRRAGEEAMPTMWAAIFMFLLAALLESWLSPSSAPYAVKALVAVASAGLLMVYFVGLGYPRSQ